MNQLEMLWKTTMERAMNGDVDRSMILYCMEAMNARDEEKFMKSLGGYYEKNHVIEKTIAKKLKKLPESDCPLKGDLMQDDSSHGDDGKVDIYIYDKGWEFLTRGNRLS